MNTGAVRNRQNSFGWVPQCCVPMFMAFLIALFLTEAVPGESPGFFSVDEATRLRTGPEQAIWVTPSSCSGTCFCGSVMLTSGTLLEVPSSEGVDRVATVPDYSAGEVQVATEESVADAESLGREPENVGLQFLRTQTVLLKPSQWQFDTGLWYTIAESDFPTVVGGSVVTEARIRQRLLAVPFEARYGLTSGIQLFASTSIGYSSTELARIGFDDTITDTGGIGDVSFGLSAQLIPGSACRPELVGTLGVTAPTGDAGLSTAFLTPEATLGEGFWGFTGSLLWVRSYDPVILFYGVGANLRLDAELSGVDVDPGERFLYQLGVGFAVNRHVTLSTAFLGSYWVEDRFDGVRVPGGVREPLRLRFAATIGKSCRIVEPFAEIGMTEDAPSSRIGITWTF